MVTHADNNAVAVKMGRIVIHNQATVQMVVSQGIKGIYVKQVFSS